MLILPKSQSARVALAYAALSALWILFSDNAVALLFAGSPSALILASTVKGWVFVAVTALLLYLGFRRREVKDRQQIEALAESEERFRSIFDNTSDLIFLHSVPDGRLLDVNRRAQEVYGYTREEMLRLDVGALSSGEQGYTQQAALAMLRDAAAGTVQVRRWHSKARDGRLFWVEVSLRQAVVGGRQVILVTGRDVGKRMEAERALRESEARYRSVIENISDVFYRTDAQGRLSMVSPSGARLLAYDSVEQMLGIPNAQFWKHPEQREAMLEQLRRHGSVHDYEVELVRRDGEPVMVSTSSAFYRDQEGNILGVEGIFRDITERKAAERALRDSRDFLEKIIDTIPDPIFVKDARHRFVLVNAVLCELADKPREEILGKTDADFFPPEQVEVFWSRDDLVLATGEVDVSEEQLTAPNGSVSTIVTKKACYQDAKGNRFVVGVLRDISERILATRAVEESEHRFRSLYTSMTEGVAIHEVLRDDSGAVVDYRLLDVNPSFELLTGIPRDKAVGSIGSALYGMTPPPYLEEYARVAQAGRPEHFVTHFSPMGKDFSISVFSPGPDQFATVFQDISAARNAERALRESRQLLSDILEFLPYATLVVDGEGRVMTWNKAMEDLTGIPAARMLGKGDYAYAVPFYGDARPIMVNLALEPDPGREGQYTGLTRHGDILSGEAYVPNLRGGRYLFVNASLLRNSDGRTVAAIECIDDITSRKQAEAALQESEETFRRIFDGGSDPILLVKNGVFVQCNMAAVRLIGAPDRDAVLGLSPLDFSPAVQPDGVPSRAAMLRNDTRAHSEGRCQFEWMCLRFDGSPLLLEVALMPIMLKGEELLHVTWRDITERKRMQEIMVQTEKMMSVGGLAAGMAHEINNPLAGILQGVQNIVRRVSLEIPANVKVAQELGCDLAALREYLRRREILEFLGAIRTSGERAAKIVNNMLSFARRTQNTSTPTNMAELLDRSVELASTDYDLKKKYDFRRIAILRDYEPDIPPVPCAPMEIEQVVLNLLKNAAQAMYASPREDEGPRIVLRLRREGDMAVIQVEDNGPGMEERVRNKVFEPFYTTKPPGEGTGLGLSVSYFIVTSAHRGSIYVESEPGKGSCFTIRLPLGKSGAMLGAGA